jgi:hypothetical protein
MDAGSAGGPSATRLRSSGDRAGRRPRSLPGRHTRAISLWTKSATPPLNPSRATGCPRTRWCRLALVHSRFKSAWRKRDKDADACWRVLAEWLAGAFPALECRPLRDDDLNCIFGCDRNWHALLGKPFARWLADAKGDAMQAETPTHRQRPSVHVRGSFRPSRPHLCAHRA